MTPDALAVIAAAFIAALPGVYASILARKARRAATLVAETATATEFGTKMAAEAFDSLTEQVQRLNRDRVDAEAERRALTTRIDNLTEVLQLTNAHLVTLMHLLDAHGIARPPLPTGLPWNPGGIIT